MRSVYQVITALSALLAAPLLAQVDRSAINGTVTDPAKSRITGAAVTAIQNDTGLMRTTVTSGHGTYALDRLPPGGYKFTFEKAGFAPKRVEQVEGIVGESRTLNVELQIGTKGDSTTVSESLAHPDATSAVVGGVIEQAQLRDLPLNGRNWTSLTALTPGAIDNGAGDQRSIRFAGHGLDDNDFLFDGVDASGVLNQAQKEYVRLAIPIDSIAEFQVQSQNFAADAGMTAGGQISVASRAGTNTFHGDLFDYFRNQVLDSRSPFDGASPDPFLLNQFGAGAGGALVKNKTFFYANYEGLRQRLGQTQIGLVPSPAFISQLVSSSPALMPIISAYPAGTSPTANPLVWNYVAAAKQVDNEDSGMLRLDQRFTDRTTAFLRYSADEAAYRIPTGALNVLASTDTRLKNGVAELFHVFSTTLVNELKFGVNEDIYHTANISPSPFTTSVSNLSRLMKK